MSNQEDVAIALRTKVEDTVSRIGKRKRRKEWVAPVLSDFAYGTVLCFDQTVNATGWAIIAHDDAGLTIPATGTVRPPPEDELSGFEASLVRALYVSKMFVTVMLTTSIFEPDAIVHEMPAVAGYRIESSLLAALGVRMAASTVLPLSVHMISNQSMKALLLHPDQREEKKYVGHMLTRYLTLNSQRGQTWNQHNHDAVALGLTYLHQKAADA
jgi:Holliday junction resolvasome RuvABC endonuclease subunit